MNKWILSLSTLLLSSAAFANQGNFSGFYGGVNIGLIQSKLQDQYNTKVTIPNRLTLTLSESPSGVTDTSFMGGITLGYTALCTRMFIIGIEGRANFQGLNTIIDDDHIEEGSLLNVETDTSTKINRDFALLAKLGIAFDPCVALYSLIGIDWGHIEISSNANFRQTLDQFFNASVQASQSSYESGLLLGLGMEYLITACTSIGLEYNYVNYNHLDFPGAISGDLFADGVVRTDASFIDTNSMKLQTNKVLIKANYYFA